MRYYLLIHVKRKKPRYLSFICQFFKILFGIVCVLSWIVFPDSLLSFQTLIKLNNLN